MWRALGQAPTRLIRLHRFSARIPRVSFCSVTGGKSDDKESSDSRLAIPSGTYQKALPNSLLVFPIHRPVVFPGTVNFLFSMDRSLLEAVAAEIRVRGTTDSKGQRCGHIGMFLAREKESQITTLEHIHKIGVLAKVSVVFPHLSITGLTRIEAREAVVSERKGPLRVKVKTHPDPDFDLEKADPAILRAHEELAAAVKQHQEGNALVQANIMTLLDNIGTNIARPNLENPYVLADLVGALCASFNNSATTALALQDLLEAREPQLRLERALKILRNEMDIFQMSSQIKSEFGGSLEREVYLREQLNRIKQELGIESDEKEAMMEKYKKRLSELDIPKQALNVIQEEMSKLSMLDTHSSEYSMTKNYLDVLTQLPWGVMSKENLDLSTAKDVLEADHYGLDDVKQRILEFIAVGKLNGHVRGKILCFVGPPGVGKTSIAKSIANALDRKFFRFSVGGLTDVAEIKGHRRTYVGAMPGKLVRSIKTAGTTNPVILIDEIDKLGRGYQGDPSSALLEALDPEQNATFLDHYVDVPFDLSEVLFICTANTLHTIPGPLLDRMEVIRLSGYVHQEKMAITQRHLLPAGRAVTGLKVKDVTVTKGAISRLIEEYCRESGVRNLQKHIEKILRKVALKVAKGEATKKVTIHPKDVVEYVGQPAYHNERVYKNPPPGIVMGLAWTQLGGDTLYIEAVPDSTKKSGIIATGQLGDVFKESHEISYIFAKAFMRKRWPANGFFKENGLHVHVPEGATPKDGPSAGVTMVTSLLSLGLGIPVKPDLAMTGEVTLTGKVLKIGGVKEKCLAARRAKVKRIVFPEANRMDFEELPEYLRKGLEVCFASTYEDVFRFAFDQKALPAPPLLEKAGTGKEGVLLVPNM